MKYKYTFILITNLLWLSSMSCRNKCWYNERVFCEFFTFQGIIWFASNLRISLTCVQPTLSGNISCVTFVQFFLLSTVTYVYTGTHLYCRQSARCKPQRHAHLASHNSLGTLSLSTFFPKVQGQVPTSFVGG